MNDVLDVVGRLGVGIPLRLFLRLRDANGLMPLRPSFLLQVVTAITLVSAVAGCSDTVGPFRNVNASLDNQATFDRDFYQCKRENTHEEAGIVGYVAYEQPVVDEDMTLQCMSARGWHQVPSHQ